MAIQLPEAPAEALEVVREHASALLNAAPPESAMRAAGGASLGVNVTQAHRVFTATLEDVIASRVLANARETTWRYFLVHEDNEPFATAEVAGKEISHFNEGPFVQGTASAMLAAEELDATHQRDYELRLLRIPALYTAAVWLASSGDDILIPAAPAPNPLIANQPYTETSFTNALRELAELRGGGDNMSG